MLGAWFIKIYQNTTFSHVLILDGDLVYQASHGSVNCVHIDVFLEKNKLITQFEVHDLDVDMIFIKKQLGKAYDYKQLFKFAIKYLTGIRLHSSNGNGKFVCSEFVGKALKLSWVTDYTSPKEIADYLIRSKELGYGG